MYLLVERDRGEPRVLERFAPWGAEDGQEYLKRLERNLDFLERHEDAQLNYELSACELRMIERARPDLVERMASLVKAERVELVGGDWSQAHAHVLGPESVFRQLARGLEETRRILGSDVTVFFHQESAVHSQMPQLLSVLGFEWAITPAFPWYVEVLQGRFEFGQWPHDGRPRSYYVPEEGSIVEWVGLDGTEIPLYLHGALGVQEGDVLDDDQQGVVHQARLWIKCPDIEEVTDEELGWMQRYGKLRCLSPALEEVATHARSAEERVRVRLGTHWSYIEGMWCEQLLQALSAAEADLVALVGACSAAAWQGRRDVALFGVEEAGRYWDELLTAQHHDIMWTETTDLKRQAIATAKRASTGASRRVREIAEALVLAAVEGDEHRGASAGLSGGYAYAINPFPYPLQVRVPGADDSIGFGEDGLLRREGQPAGAEVGGIRTVATVSNFGLAKIEPAWTSAAAPTPTDAVVPRVVDGHLSWLASDGGSQLLAPGSGAVTYRREDGSIASSVGALSPVEQKLEADYELYRFGGELDDIKLAVTFLLWPRAGVAEAEYALSFEEKELGVMWDDLSKLQVQWLMPDARRSSHDIPFGVVEARPGTVVHATSWFAGEVSDEECVQIVHFGNPKFIVQRGSVSNVLAWGGRQFTNRMARRFLRASQYDLRLDGTFTSRFVVSATRPDPCTLARKAQGLRLNPELVFSPQPLDLPRSPHWPSLPEPLVCTSVELDEGKLRMRVFNCSDSPVPSSAVSSPGHLQLTSLDGAEIGGLGPWKIGYAVLS
jgi:hypothetical protein